MAVRTYAACIEPIQLIAEFRAGQPAVQDQLIRAWRQEADLEEAQYVRGNAAKVPVVVIARKTSRRVGHSKLPV
jgi:hypothetical protein